MRGGGIRDTLLLIPGSLLPESERRFLVKHLDRIANIAVIVAVVVFLALVVRGDFAWHRIPQTAQAPSQNLIGTTVSLPGVQFPKDRSSLLLVVSTQCHFCKDSLPFYKDLTAKSHGRLNVVAVLPQPQAEAQKFLQDAGVEANQVVTATPDTLGVRGTPTVLLVDSSGKVKHEWVGRLDQSGQKDLLEESLPGA